MNKDAASHKIKPEPIPEAISSVILGILGVLSTIVIIAMIAWGIDVPSYSRDIWGVDNNIMLVAVKWGWLFSVIGLTLGTMGIKSSAKRLAICGIVLSAVTLPINLLAFIDTDSIREIFPFIFIKYPLF